MKKSVVLLVFLFGLLVLSSGQTMAQTCPGGKTVFIWVNGVFVGDQTVNGVFKSGSQVWADTVWDIRTNFLAAHPNLDPNCVKFVAVWNSSQGVFDIVQSIEQWYLQQIEALLQGYNFVTNPNDPDYLSIVNEVNTWSSAGYRVVLVGHSQGTFFTNEVYENLTTSPPDLRKLAVVNIASAVSYVNNGIEKYTTQCGDPVHLVPYSLPANVGQTANVVPPYTLTCSTQDQVNLHLLESYLADGSVTKQKIYSHLEDSLPDPGCGADTNCYLKDPFTSGSLSNFEKVDYGIANNGNPIVASSGGVLRMTSQVPPLFATAHLTVNTRRYFVGDFTASFEYNSYGTDANDIRLVNAKDNIVISHRSVDPAAANTNWYPITFTKTSSQVSLYVNGAFIGSVPTTAASGYYLQFDLLNNSTLQIRNFSVVSGATPPVPSMTLTPATNTVSVVQGSSKNVDLVLASQNGMTGNTTLGLYCTQTCPTGITYSFPTSGTLPVNGSLPIRLTFNPSSTPVGTYNYQYRATLNGVTKSAAIALTVTAPTTGTVRITINPDAHTTHSAVFCYIVGGPGVTITYSAGILGGLAPGVKTIVCDPPIGYPILSITPSTTQNLSAGQTINFIVNLRLPPPLFLDHLTVDTVPKVNTRIRITLYGAGFVSDTTPYVCTSSSTSSCVVADVNTRNLAGTQIGMKLTSSTARTFYIRVRNSDGVWSGYKTMVVIN